MAVLVGFDPAQFEHDPGDGHVERPPRAEAVLRGLVASGLEGSLALFKPRTASAEELGRVHEASYVAALERRCASGGGVLDPDTAVGSRSFEVALRAAGAGLDAVARLEAGAGDAAFLALRPPGHHARRGAAMGFCLFNSVAVTAAGLVAAGERVLIIDWDAHHGNGTQEMFYSEPDVLYVSMHQYPWYPGTGSIEDTGAGLGAGTTINVPFPSRTAGDAYRLALDELVIPAAEAFSASWLLVSAGFDAHRDDPLSDLELSSGDFADLTEQVALLVPPGRRILFLEGGYDLAALERCVAGCVSALGGSRLVPERPTSGGRDGLHGAGPSGRPASVVARARQLHEQALASAGDPCRARFSGSGSPSNRSCPGESGG